jgi:flagellar protein FlaG
LIGQAVMVARSSLPVAFGPARQRRALRTAKELTMSYDAMSTVKMPAFTPRANVGGAGPKHGVAVQEAEVAATAQVVAQTVSTAVPSRDAVQAAASQIESWLKSAGRELEFRVDEGSGQMVVSVRDASSGELIRQIPGEAVLRMARQLKESKPSLVNLTV